MARLLLLCAGGRDLRELSAIDPTGSHRLFRHDYGTDALEELVSGASPHGAWLRAPADEISAIVGRFGGARLDGVITTDDYPGSTLASVVAKRLGLRGPDPLADLTCQHKLLSRRAQRTAAPEAVPWFASAGEGAGNPDGIRFPAFVKPVKSFFSIGARRVDSEAELREAIASNPAAGRFLAPFDWFLREFAGTGVGPPLIVEGLLEGAQVTLDGFVCGGQVVTLGVVDSIMFPGTISFERFEYPSSLPASVQRRLSDVAAAVIRSAGFDNGLFNIEFIVDPATGGVWIVEINPRMSSQFADLYEKVDGFNPYQVLVDVATGREPVVASRRGRHAMAASCVLRTFADREVVAVPSACHCDALRALHPDARIEILATPGRRLSHAMQDGSSFRYGLVNLGGDDRADILAKFDACRRALPFTLLPIGCIEGLGGRRTLPRALSPSPRREPT
jgi:hypothetical protein